VTNEGREGAVTDEEIRRVVMNSEP
jgi:hypothetical protein